MSLITYNGVTLPYPDITRFEQKPLGDEVSDTDWYCTEFNIEVQCMVNTDYIGSLLPDLWNQFERGVQYSPAEIMRLVRVRLLARRKTLSVTFNGTELIPQRAGVPGTVDAKNGPVPQFCRIIELTNTTFLVHYAIQAHYWESYESLSIENTNRPGNPVLYNRWSEQVVMDGCQFSTRVRAGKYAIRSDNVRGATADLLRSNMAIVSVPEGFLRKKSEYRVDPSGLAIEYTVIDEEQFKMPPAPAFEATGTYEEMSPKGAAMRIATVIVELRGAKTTPQDQLAITAVRVARDKLRANEVRLPEQGVGNGGFVVGVFNAFFRPIAIPLEIITLIDMYHNAVKVSFKVMTGVGRGSAWTNNPGLVATPYSSNTYTPPYTDRGTATFLLQAAAYYDPSVVGNNLGGGTQGTDENPYTTVDDEKVNMQQGAQPGEAGAQP